MIRHRFREELASLKELAAEFAAAHPALAPMLGRMSADPDVERLLEGVAFQNALLRQKLDDDFPELIHDLARLVCPQYLRPIPASTVVAFSPKSPFSGKETIPAGTTLASVPVDGTRCLFRTCAKVELHPLEILDAVYRDPPAEAPNVTILLALRGLPLAQWSPDTLRFFLSGEFPEAADLYLLLCRHLRKIRVVPEEGGASAVLTPQCLVPQGFAADEAVIPFPPQAYPGYRLLQEYLAVPQRFLFLDLKGWERWTERGIGFRFKIVFEFSPFKTPPPKIARDSFALFATPAVNLFEEDAVPIVLDHRKERYPVRPDRLPSHHAAIFTVDSVTGYLHGTSIERQYRRFDLFDSVSREEPSYHLTIAPSLTRHGYDHHLAVDYPDGGGLLQEETVSVRLTCTNGELAERLRVGDLYHPTDTSPECASFTNITAVFAGRMPPLGHDLLWRLVSHLALNRLTLADAGNLRTLLGLYLFEEGGDSAALEANRRRIDAIEEVMVTPSERLLKGVLFRGLEATLQLNGDGFASAGDLFLFGSVLDRFLAGYVSLNSFTRLSVFDTCTKETIAWQPRLGEQTLL